MGSGTVSRIQQALKAKGFDPGELDGIWGRRTIAAVRQFQTQHGLEVDGVVGPKTMTALFAGMAPALPTAGSLLPWFEEAKNLMGTKEILGRASNPVILDWAKTLDIDYAGDDVPWCGLFVAHCIGSTLPHEMLPGNPLGARQWEKFGDRTSPPLGAIMVFWRESPASGKGHVGFYVGQDENETAYQIVGGNQSNMVCLTWLAKDRLRGARWPRTADSLVTSAVTKAKQQGLSMDEA
jgi:uncharacterized protein (TIGR02594 family)